MWVSLVTEVWAFIWVTFPPFVSAVNRFPVTDRFSCFSAHPVSWTCFSSCGFICSMLLVLNWLSWALAQLSTVFWQWIRFFLSENSADPPTGSFSLTVELNSSSPESIQHQDKTCFGWCFTTTSYCCVLHRFWLSAMSLVQKAVLTYSHFGIVLFYLCQWGCRYAAPCWCWRLCTLRFV